MREFSNGARRSSFRRSFAYFPVLLNPHAAKAKIEREVMEAFLAQHYADQFIPSLVVLNVELDAPELMLALMKQCGHTFTASTNHKNKTRMVRDGGQRSQVGFGTTAFRTRCTAVTH